MKTFPVSSDRVSLAVTETGGHLSDVAFTLDSGQRVTPMHVAPWAEEQLPQGTPPVLRVLRGDFFCAPFGSSDLLPEAPWVHGLTANGTWRLVQAGAGTIDMVLDGKVMGATVTKHVELRAGQPVVYQRHNLAGGSGRLPIGHHAMLKAEHPLQLGFSNWSLALTPPEPVEVPPLGRSLLQSGQTISDLRRARRADGGTADLTLFPTADGYEALWMLVSDRTLPFAWTAATCAEEGWVWFALKDQRVLPQTLLWLSNGGRDYAPWNGRHGPAIGLEEICGNFHLGHAASIADNSVAAGGSPSAVTLNRETPLRVSYLFGVTAVPPDFAAVRDIVTVPGGIRLVDAGGREAFARCDASFVAG